MMQLQSPTPAARVFMTVASGGGDNLPSEHAEDATVGLNLRLLIVEDEILVAMNMEAALSEAGFEIVGTVDNEADAVASALQLRPDVIVIDITLRDGDGIEAAKVIGKAIKTRIVFVSGNSDPATLAAAYALRPAGFIRKPFVTERFASLVIEAVGKSGSPAQGQEW